MAKNSHVDNSSPIEKSTYSTGTRGESAVARNRAGNHTGNRMPANRARGAKNTRTPKSY